MLRRRVRRAWTRTRRRGVGLGRRRRRGPTPKRGVQRQASDASKGQAWAPRVETKARTDGEELRTSKGAAATGEARKTWGRP